MTLRTIDPSTETPYAGDIINITIHGKPGHGDHAMLTYELISLPPVGVTADKALGFKTHAIPHIMVVLTHHADNTWRWNRHIEPNSWRTVEILRREPEKDILQS